MNGLLLSEYHACCKFRYSSLPSILLVPCAPWAWWPCCALRGIWARKVELVTQLSFLLHWCVEKPFWRRNGVVRIATRLQAGQMKSLGSNAIRGKRLFPSPKRPHHSWAHPASFSGRDVSPGMKWPCGESDHPALFMAELRLSGAVTSLPHVLCNIAFTFTCPVFWTSLCRPSCKGGGDAGGREETRERKLSEGWWYLDSRS
jgi:hypothetical protein